MKDRFRKIKNNHIEYVLKKLEETTEKVINIKKYLMAVLFNSTVSCNSYFWMETKPSCYWLAWLILIRNRTNVKPRAALRGISRLYICEISCILHNCKSVSLSPDCMDTETGIFKRRIQSDLWWKKWSCWTTEDQNFGMLEHIVKKKIWWMKSVKKVKKCCNRIDCNTFFRYKRYIVSA